MPKKNSKDFLTDNSVRSTDPVGGEQFSSSARKSRLRFYMAMLLGAGLLIGVLVYVYSIQQESRTAKEQLNKIKSNPQEQAKEEVSQLLQQLGKLLILPESEQPTVATVTDTEKLKDQPFFARAQVGDKVIIYSQAQKAILFRPGENKIVEVAPFVGLSSGQVSPPSAARPLRLEIRNGSGQSGAANNLKNQLAGNSQISIVATGNANRLYDKTLFVDLSGGARRNDLEKLASTLSGTIVSELPAGEAASQAEALIIIGKE